MLTYQIEENLPAVEFQQLLLTSTLGERRPAEDLKRLEAMVKNANLIITARNAGVLVGVARSVTDFVYCTYLSDLAVDLQYQKQGIGKKLIQLTKQATPQATTILLAAPKAADYYPHIGMTQHNACFTLVNETDLK